MLSKRLSESYFSYCNLGFGFDYCIHIHIHIHKTSAEAQTLGQCLNFRQLQFMMLTNNYIIRSHVS